MSGTGAAPTQPAPTQPTPQTQSPTTVILADILKGFYTQVKSFTGNIFDLDNLLIIPELCHLSPILFTVGTFLFALLTLNYPIALFGVGALEAMALHSPLSILGSYFLQPDDLQPGDKPLATECTSRFQKMTKFRFEDFISKGLKPEFPHYGLYFLSFASGYMIQCMTFLSEEISLMGETYSNRLYLSILGAAMFIAVYLVHLMMYGCSSTSTLLFTVIVGVFVGIMISLLHFSIGGKEAINTLFVPPVVKREGLDYLCVKNS